MSTLQSVEPQAPVAVPPGKFVGFAWSALILGIIGVVGSPIIFLNNVTAIIAGVGFILSLIAFFGTKKILAFIGMTLCIAAIVFTVMAQSAVVKEIDKAFGRSDTAQTYQVGETHKGSDIDVTVANPQNILTGNSAMPEQKAKAIKYEVTLVSHSDKPQSVALISFNATAGSKAAEEVFDSSAGLGGSPSQDLLPGKTLTFSVAFIDADPGEIVVQVRPLMGDRLYFTHQR